MSEHKKTDAELMAEAMGAAVQKGISDGITMAKMAELEAAAASKAGADKARVKTITRCPKCGQKEKTCGGPVADDDGVVRATSEDKNHVKMVVLPEDPEDVRFFQGIRLNGKVYLSNSHNHFIMVPRKNNFAWILANYKRNERDQRRGRKATHNSGSIGGKGAGFKPATVGWR